MCIRALPHTVLLQQEYGSMLRTRQRITDVGAQQIAQITEEYCTFFFFFLVLSLELVALS